MPELRFIFECETPFKFECNLHTIKSCAVKKYLKLNGDIMRQNNHKKHEFTISKAYGMYSI